MDLDVREVFKRDRASNPLISNEIFPPGRESENRYPMINNASCISRLHHNPIKLKQVRLRTKFMIKSVEQIQRFWGRCIMIERYAEDKRLTMVTSIFFIPKVENEKASNESLTERNTLGYYVNCYGRYIIGSPIYMGETPSRIKVIIAEDNHFNIGTYLVVSILDPLELKNSGYSSFYLWSDIIQANDKQLNYCG